MKRSLDDGCSGKTQRTFADPPVGIVAVTPSDTVNLPNPIRGFMVAAAGNVKVTMLDGTVGTYPGCAVGAQYAGMIMRVWSTGTTAAGIVGFF